jgi:glycosyltransferase involved in cell wall biosynthesis
MEGVVAQCQGMEKMLLDNALVEPGKLHCIYNPVSRNLLEKTDKIRLPRENRSPDREKQIVFIGRLDPQKNLPHLLRAFALLRENEPTATLHLYGEGGQKENLEKLAEELNIRDRVCFEGVRKDMETVYAAADMVVLSSAYEGMPNCLIEAIGCGVPVVSYDCPLGPAEIIVDGVNGYLVEYQNIEALAKGMEQCLVMERTDEQIKATAAKFDVSHIAEQYLELFARTTR